LYADAERQREFVEQRWPQRHLPKYAPEAMIPELNELGEQGWELVHMEPVGGVGKKGDVSFTRGYGTMRVWSNAYSCVFKRRTGGYMTGSCQGPSSHDSDRPTGQAEHRTQHIVEPRTEEETGHGAMDDDGDQKQREGAMKCS